MWSRIGPGVLAATAASILMFAAVATAQSSPPPASADPGLDSALGAIELMNRVPVGIRETCGPTDTFIEGMAIAVQCTVDGGIVFYSRFVDDAAVQAAYESLRASSGTERDTGPGCAEGASEAAYGDEDGLPDGRVLCHATNGAYISVWTHADEPILAGMLLDSESGFAVLAETWQRALLDAEPALPPSASAAPSGSGGPAASSRPAPPTPPTASASAPAASEGDVLLQWASSASASSEYGADAWSASQATGEPDTSDYGDVATAWAPSGADVGLQWLEVGYDVPVRPTEVVIWESSGAGFVTLLEALDVRSEEWVTLWEGSDGSPDFLVGFSPPLAGTDVVTDTLRVTIDTAMPGWNEIDAVGLFGVPAEP